MKISSRSCFRWKCSNSYVYIVELSLIKGNALQFSSSLYVYSVHPLLHTHTHTRAHLYFNIRKQVYANIFQLQLNNGTLLVCFVIASVGSINVNKHMLIEIRIHIFCLFNAHLFDMYVYLYLYHYRRYAYVQHSKWTTKNILSAFLFNFRQKFLTNTTLLP